MNSNPNGGALNEVTQGMLYTLGQAAKATGKNKGTISNAIKKGRLSASKNDKGEYEIDPAELHRVYSPASPSDTEQVALPVVPPVNTPPLTTVERRLMQERIDDLKADLAREREATDQWREQAQKLLLTRDINTASVPASSSHAQRPGRFAAAWAALTRKT